MTVAQLRELLALVPAECDGYTVVSPHLSRDCEVLCLISYAPDDLDELYPDGALALSPVPATDDPTIGCLVWRPVSRRR